jgi:hypothetical protein
MPQRWQGIPNLSSLLKEMTEMMNFMIIFFTFLYPSLSHSNNGARWVKLMELINQEIHLLQKAKNKNDEINYRLLELYSEKIKLIHEKSNRDFLNAVKINRNSDKENYFIATRKYYHQIKEFGVKLLSQKYPSKKKKEILYTLGLNSRDYGTDGASEKFLLEAITIASNENNHLQHQIQTALADIYYNEKRYPEAVGFYEKVIKQSSDEWHTKHLLNLSWCYLKNRNFEKAIETIKAAYTASLDPKYINVRDQVLEHIDAFYVYGNLPLEALEFYLSMVKDPIPYLFVLASKSSEKGLSKESQIIFTKIQNLIDERKIFKYQEELYLSLLDFYRQYNQTGEFLQTTSLLARFYSILEKNNLKNSNSTIEIRHKGDAIAKIRSLAGYLQIKLAKDLKNNERYFSKNDLQLLLHLFDHLSTLDPLKISEYLYFRAETYFSINLFSTAAKYYSMAIHELSKSKSRDEELLRKSLDSLLALTSRGEFLGDELRKYLILAYTKHIEFWPTDDKSKQIYPKLFEIYFESNDDLRATETIKSYHRFYPDEILNQQNLMTRVLDRYIENKKTEKINFWLVQFKQGFLSFPKTMISKTELILGSLLFLEYQKLSKKGQFIEASKGFITLFSNSLYPEKIRSQAAFFAALSFLEIGMTLESFKWLKQSQLLMTRSHLFESRNEILAIAERSYKLHDFETSFKISENLLETFCSSRDEIQSRFFEISIMTSLVEENFSRAEDIIRTFSGCLKDAAKRSIAVTQIFEALEKKGDFFKLRRFYKLFSENISIADYGLILQKWYWSTQNENFKAHILSEFKDLKNPEINSWHDEISLYKQAQSESKDLLSLVIWSRADFDPAEFNLALEGYLSKIKKFKDKYSHLSRSKQTDLAIISTNMFSKIFFDISQKIALLSPHTLESDKKSQFLAAMKVLSHQFLHASKSFESALHSVIMEKETLTWGARIINSREGIENPVLSSFTGLTMDKVKD